MNKPPIRYGVGGGALGDVASNAMIAHCAQAPRAGDIGEIPSNGANAIAID